MTKLENLFTKILENSREYNELERGIKENLSPILLNGFSGTSIAHIVSSIGLKKNRQSLIVTYNEIEAKKIYEDLKFFDEENAYLFPSKEIVFYSVYAHSNEIDEERLKTLDAIISGKPCIVVCTVESLLRKLMPRELWKSYVIELGLGKTINLDSLIEDLINMGFERVDMVQGKGQFSIRGGIIDVFPIINENPYRIELFDDEIDSIRIFNLETQLSIEKVAEIKIKPSREMILNRGLIEKAIVKIEEEFGRQIKRLKGDKRNNLEDKLGEIITNLKNDIYFDGIDNFIDYFTDEPGSLLDYLDQDGLIFIHESSRLNQRVKVHTDEFKERFKISLEKGEVLQGQGYILEKYDAVLRKLEDRETIILSSLPKRIVGFNPEQIINFNIQEMNTYHGKLDILKEDLINWKYKGFKIIILTGTEDRGKKLEEELKSMDVEVSYIKDFNTGISSGQVFISKGRLNNGVIYSTFKFIIISDKEIYGMSKKPKRKRSKHKNGRKIKSFRDLNIGDYVVHENHGIGKYIGIDQLKVEGIKKDYLKIKYSGEDYLYVPIDQMDLVQKYIGGDDRGPKLNKLGGSEWRKTKAKVKTAIEDMANDLLKLYAVRETAKGYSFSEDTQWQREFEDMFPYEETPDQLRCIEEVKHDMERNMPMDRLLCGDVGYGKTEVAIRAVFKAVVEGKQVAFLVPTTILAQQHFNTLKERLSKFPVRVEMLSRFRSAAEQKKIIEDIRTGMVDIVVGTHRLLSKDIKFKDIGFLIVDEEQRFGVKHKEALKQFKRNIDVLTLTATPIPRTLHMSLIGLRDMSVIEDPPEDRYPVQTYVASYNDDMIGEAIIKELEREGQVYFVYNRVQDIEKVTAKLKRLVPDARIAYAHGQMGEKKLENIMIDFLNKEIDVLVCTTIIETGLDIGNVNTIIIYDADKMGLSQLYQLRGRVGRSNRMAYCYLTYQKDKILSEVAEKRLKAIKEFTELGSGFKIAMKDLEIRGAGNLLGSQQHGHMASIGYDLYCKLLEDTIRGLKGEDIEETIETNIDINVDAYISDKYITNEKHKLEIYKKIASIRDKQDAYDIEEEIEDRFGTLPNPVYNLISIAYIKVLAQRIKVSSITQVKDGYKFQFDDNINLDPMVIVKANEEFGRRVNFNCGNKPYFVYKIMKKTNRQIDELKEIENMLEKIKGFN